MSLQATHKELTFHIGDTVRVHYRIIEREKEAGKTKKSVEVKIKERIQPFEGVVIAINGIAENKSFTVRRIADQNIGIERVFPIVSPWVEKVEVTQQGKARRAKLYYLRGRGNLDVRQILPETKKSSKTQRSKDSKKTKDLTKPNAKSSKKSSEKKPRAKRRTPRKKVSAK